MGVFVPWPQQFSCLIFTWGEQTLSKLFCSAERRQANTLLGFMPNENNYHLAVLAFLLTS